MKFAFSAPDRGTDERSALLGGFRAAGFDGLQLKRKQYENDLDDPDRFLARWDEKPGVASGLITAGDLGDEAIADLRRVIGFAAAVGSERIVYCHGVPRTSVSDNEMRRFGRLFSELGAEALGQEVRLSLHHHYNQPVMHRPDFDVFFGEVADGRVGLTIDTAHLVKSGITDVAGIITDFASVIDNVHVKDIADGAFVPLGDGEIDFEPVFAAIEAIGFDGWLCADEESGAVIVDAMAASHRFLTRAVASVHGGIA